MSRTDTGNTPRAVVHRRILDVADARPDASVEAIADDVTGATPDLVQRVFDEYGDPATEPSDDAPRQEPTPAPAHGASPDRNTTETMTENGQHAAGEPAEKPVDPASLPERQRETLRLVHDHPDWSQADLAERLDVSRATVSRRLNAVPGFEWRDREAFARTVFDDEPGGGDATPGDAAPGASADGETPRNGTGDGRDEGALAEFEERLDDLESRVADGNAAVDLPPGLAHKVVHACMESDRISEDEELALLEALLR